MPDTSLGITYPGSTASVRPYADMQTLAEDVDALITTDRTARDGTWTSFSPTLTGATSGGSMGNATLTCVYKKYGRLVVARYKVVIGSTTSWGTGAALFSLPVTSQTGVDHHVGSAALFDVSANGRYPGGGCELNTNANFLIISGAGAGSATGAGQVVGSASPFTWATGDEVRATIVYEANAA